MFALILAAVIGTSSFANTDAVDFSAACRGGNSNSGRYQSQKISIPLDGGSKQIPLRKIKMGGAFAKFDQDKGTVAVGSDDAFAAANAVPGAKVRFHQNFPGGDELDCTGTVE